MSVRSLVLTLVFAVLALAPIGRAQTTGGVPSDVQVSVLTFGPGPIVYERFGHVAVRLRTPRFDVCYDWGNFSFDDPAFLWRFVRGENRYWVEQKDTADMLRFYVGVLDRTVIEQRLDLSPAETDRLIRTLAAQDTAANRYYGYDYYRDNCATRVRDLIDAGTGGRLRAAAGKAVQPGYRWQTRRLLWSGLDNKLLATLIDFSCGPRVDPPMTAWDAAFLPMELSRTLDTVTLVDDRGASRPLVAERRVLNTTRLAENAEPAAPGAIWLAPLLIGLAGAAALVAGARWFRPGFAVVAFAWEAFAAFGGLFFAFVILFTRHWVVAWNENFLQFTPFGLIVIAAIVVRRWRPRLQWAAGTAVGLSLLGLLISPLTPQLNAPAIALALPMHLAVWYGLWTRARHTPAPLEGTAV